MYDMQVTILVDFGYGVVFHLKASTNLKIFKEWDLWNAGKCELMDPTLSMTGNLC